MSVFELHLSGSAASRYTVESPTNAAMDLAGFFVSRLRETSAPAGGSVREQLQKQMPPRAKTKAVIDKLRGSADPWLEDDYD